VAEVGICRRFANRDRILAFVAEGNLFLTPASYGLALVFGLASTLSVTSTLPEAVAVTQMGLLGRSAYREGVLSLMAERDLFLTPADPVLFVPALSGLGAVKTLASMLGPTVLLADARAGSRLHFDGFGYGWFLGLLYGRFGNDGRLGDIIGSLLATFRLGRWTIWYGRLQIFHHCRLEGRALKCGRLSRVIAAGSGYGHARHRQQEYYQGNQDNCAVYQWLLSVRLTLRTAIGTQLEAL
jgi:hypothetical protein